jgi:hypothetical protein
MMTKKTISLLPMAESAYDSYIEANLSYDLHPPLAQWSDTSDETKNIWCAVAYEVMASDTSRYDAIKKLKDLLGSIDKESSLYYKISDIINVLTV